MTEKAVQFDWEKITGPLGETEDIFKDEIKRIEKLCNGYDFEKNSSNVISIVGNRGCGKTSLIKAVQKHFKPKDDKEKNISDDEKARYKNFYVTDTIDPSIFDDTLLIPEFFISVLAQQVEKSKENSSYEFAEFHKKLNEIMEVISHIKSNKERFYEDNHPSDIVRTIQKRYRFDELLKELIKSFYTAIGKDKETKMIVCIDDLDLVSNKYVYRMIEDIQKWLNKNCIVIVSFREVQLLNIIQDQFIKQNMNLIDKEIISISEIRDQTIQFYEKQMPVSRRIYLKGQKEFFNETARDILKPFVKNMGEIDKSENDNKKDVECTDNEFIWKCLKNEEINFHDFMEKMVRRKVALPLDPVDEKERVHLIYPNGLREMLAFVRMLVEMNEIRSETKEGEGAILKENLQENLKIYRDYILSRAKANLNGEYYSIIDEWLKTSVGNKNYYICSKIDKFLKDDTKDKKSFDYHQENVLYLNDEEDDEENDVVDLGKEEDLKTETQSQNKMNSNIINVDKSSGNFSYNNASMIYVEKTDSYNVMLGDVVQFIEKLKCTMAHNEEIMYFSYLIKLLYSIELLYALFGKYEISRDDNGNIKYTYVRNLNDIDYDSVCDNYISLVNCKFTPDDFSYTQFDENMISFIEAELDENDIALIDMVTNMSYSKIRRKSDIWNVARPKKIGTSSTYKHRPLFYNNLSKKDLTKNSKNKLISNYNIDPMSYVLKKSYFEKMDGGNYVFYSVFDIDIITRMIFANKKKEGKVTYVYRKINWIFNNINDKFSSRSLHDTVLKSQISQLFNGKNNLFDREFVKRMGELERDVNLKNEISPEIMSLMNKICKADIHSWRKLAEGIKNISTLSEDDKQRAKKMSDGLNTKNRRVLWSEEESDFKYFLQKYPEVRALFK